MPDEPDDNLVPPLKVMRKRLNGAYRADSGFSGPTRRYVLIVALLVGLASLPTLAAITAGSQRAGRRHHGHDGRPVHAAGVAGAGPASSPPAVTGPASAGSAGGARRHPPGGGPSGSPPGSSPTRSGSAPGILARPVGTPSSAALAGPAPVGTPPVGAIRRPGLGRPASGRRRSGVQLGRGAPAWPGGGDRTGCAARTATISARGDGSVRAGIGASGSGRCDESGRRPARCRGGSAATAACHRSAIARSTRPLGPTALGMPGTRATSGRADEPGADRDGTGRAGRPGDAAEPAMPGSLRAGWPRGASTGRR